MRDGGCPEGKGSQDQRKEKDKKKVGRGGSFTSHNKGKCCTPCTWSLQLRFRRKCAAAELRWKVGGVSSPAARASVLSGPRRSLDRSWAFETLPSPAGFLPELGWVATCT